MDDTRSFGVAREPERKKITGVSRTQWWRLEGKGDAPKRVRLGPNMVGWLRDELYSWIAERAAKRETREMVAQRERGPALPIGRPPREHALWRTQIGEYQPPPSTQRQN